MLFSYPLLRPSVPSLCGFLECGGAGLSERETLPPPQRSQFSALLVRQWRSGVCVSATATVRLRELCARSLAPSAAANAISQFSTLRSQPIARTTGDLSADSPSRTRRSRPFSQDIMTATPKAVAAAEAVRRAAARPEGGAWKYAAGTVLSLVATGVLAVMANVRTNRI